MINDHELKGIICIYDIFNGDINADTTIDYFHLVIRIVLSFLVLNEVGGLFTTV